MERLSTLAETTDPRVLQILALGSFLAIGVLTRDFSLSWHQVALTFAGALGTQAFWLRRLGLHRVGYLSAVVTGFGLSVLVRADNAWAHPLLAAVAISSKFLLRLDDRHLLNPANLGAVLAAWAVPGAWVSPGQWGHDVLVAGWILALGTLVTRRAGRLDAGWTFLAIHLALTAARVGVLGQPWPVIAHTLQNGALLIFAFFMISDPPTTPAHPRARLLHLAIVAALAHLWQHGAGLPHGLIVSLMLCTPLVIALERWFPAPRHQWRVDPSDPRRAIGAPSLQAASRIGGDGPPAKAR